MVAAPPPPVAYWRIPGERGRGQPVYPEHVEAIMVEISGRRALQELILDRLLARELARMQITLKPDAQEREQELLLAALDASDPDRATILLEQLRLREGLGPTRFTALLRRNASLRALVQDDVDLREEAVQAAWDRDHGPRRVARVIVTTDLATAAKITDRLEGGEAFGELAAEISIDPSASTGGLLDPVSRHDPSWPSSFREVLWSLEPGTVSAPVLVDENYVLITCLQEQPGDGIRFEDARAEAERIVRRAQERLLMDATARRMLEGVQVDVIDSELNRAYRESVTGVTSASTPPARTKSEAIPRSAGVP